jgi:regulator of protease activity HflC (stomatin/prohibitin superfamily)
MDVFLSLFATITVILGYSFASMKIINEGNQALVERLGQYHKKLEPGLNFIIPFLDSIVIQENTREKVLNIEPQNAITKDNVSLKIDAIVYWRVVDLEKTFYEVEDIEDAIENLVLTNVRSAIGELVLEETYSSRKPINLKLLRELDDATGNWGVKITRVEVKNIEPVPTVMESLEQERAAESKKRAALLEAEGTVGSIKMISQVLEQEANAEAVLQFIVAQRYVEANENLSNSTNSKIIFMDPKALNEAISHLMSEKKPHPTPVNPPNSPINPPPNP